MQVTSASYLTEQGLLVYVFDTGALLYYGAGVVVGTDVETNRFVHSSGFGWSSGSYKEGLVLAAAYSRGAGYAGGVQEHFESCQRLR